MNENIFLPIIGLLAIAFIWLLWFRHTLLRNLGALREKESLLKKDFWRRRDTIPYLLESFKTEKEVDDIWRRLVEVRARFHITDEPQNEKEIDELLKKFLTTTGQVKNINFQEARKDIADLNRHIETESLEMKQSMENYALLRKRFPYSLASAIFSFPEIGV